MRPQIAALVAKSIGNFTASKGADKLMDPRVRAQFAETFPDGLRNIKWYPAIPPGLEEIEGGVLDKVKAAARARRPRRRRKRRRTLRCGS